MEFRMLHFELMDAQKVIEGLEAEATEIDREQRDYEAQRLQEKRRAEVLYPRIRASS